MNYQIKQLIAYATLIYGDERDFVKTCLEGYFKNYIDNYYYEIFHTVEQGVYNEEVLRLEFKGIMEEMLDDYLEFELQVSNEEYTRNCRAIQELRDIAFEVTGFDRLELKDGDDIHLKVEEFVRCNPLLNELASKNISKLSSLVKETFQTNKKLLELDDTYFELEKVPFVGSKKEGFLRLKERIKVLDNYKKTMVMKVYGEPKFDSKKLECLIQKVSLVILKGVLNHEKIERIFIELSDKVISRGRINTKIFKLIDNPLFRKYVVLCVNYNTYLNQKNAFSEDFDFGCIQDFSHIYDVYAKVDTIYNEGIFNYLIVSNCRSKDRDFFLEYSNEGMTVLVIEEE